MHGPALIILAVGSADVRIWSMNGTLITVFTGHADRINCITELGSGLYATGSQDGTVLVWFPDGTLIATLHLPAPIMGITALSHGGFVATFNGSNLPQIFSAENTQIGCLNFANKSLVSILPNGDIVTANTSNTQQDYIGIYTATGEAVTQFGCYGLGGLSTKTLPDGRILASNRDKTQLWSPNVAPLVKTKRGHAAISRLVQSGE